MSKTDLERAIVTGIESNQFGSLATVEGGKPKLRYMAVFNDGLNIYMATNRCTHKVEELEDNPNISLLLGYEAGGTKDVLEIEGTASVTKDSGLRKKLWDDGFSKWFSGPEDPNYVILDITPNRIEYTGQGQDKQVWEA